MDRVDPSIAPLENTHSRIVCTKDFNSMFIIEKRLTIPTSASGGSIIQGRKLKKRCHQMALPVMPNQTFSRFSFGPAASNSILPEWYPTC
jgi:hypothetical protein